MKYLSVLILFYLSVCIHAWPQTNSPLLGRAHGFYDSPFSLDISCADTSASLYYTTDGTVPSKENGVKYSAPLQVSGTTVLRVVAINDTLGVSNVVTATYLFLDDVLKQDNTPEGYPTEWGKYATRSGKAKADYEMDSEMTSDKDFCELLKKGFLSLPVVSIVTDPSHLFNDEENDSTGGIYIYTGAPSGSGKPGRGWERPVSFEMFDARGKHDLQVNCGIKIHGGHSRLPEKSPKHSFRLVFSKDYGVKKLKYPLFGEDEPSKLNAIVLRTAFCNSWHHQEAGQREIALYSRDMWAKKTQKEMGHLTTNGIYAHLFINGLYWGLYNPTERIDDDFCESHLGGDKIDYDVIKVEEYGTSHVVIADAGTMDQWNELFALSENANDMATYYQMQGLNEQGERDLSIAPLLNVDNFIDYMLINYYGGNSDWDSHNWLAVRNRFTNDEGFHFICWDSEHILKGVSDNILSKKTNQSPTYLFRNLIKNPLFKHQFMNRVQKHCFDNGVLTPQRGAARWLALDAMIDTALYCEQARWGDYRRDVHKYTSKGELYTKENHYNPQREFLLETYFPQRAEAFVSQLVDKGWFPTIQAPAIHYLGEEAYLTDTIEADEGVTLQGEGTLYYTVNGDAPVLWDEDSEGILGSSAIRYTDEPILSEENFTLKAIAYKDNEWSAVREHTFSVRVKPDGIQVGRYTPLTMTFGYVRNNPVLTFHLPTDSDVSLAIYNPQGVMVCHLVDGKKMAKGKHAIEIPSGSLAPGIYICRLSAGGASATIKIGVKR